MGLLTDPGATKNLGAKIEKFGDKLGALAFVAGLVWLGAQLCGVKYCILLSLPSFETFLNFFF